MSQSSLIGNLDPDELCVSSPESAKEEEERPPRRSSQASFVRARAFSRMNKEEQRSFISLRFQQLDAQELAGIFKAIYGRPPTKEGPGRKAELH